MDGLGIRAPSPLFAKDAPSSSSVAVPLLRALNPIAFAAVAAINGVSSAGLLGGRSQVDVSDSHPTPITPAGYGFSIWGLIYLAQGVLFLVYEFLPCVNRGLVFGRVGYRHLLLCALNIAWIFAFAYEQMVLQAVILWGNLASLAEIYLRIHWAARDGSTGPASVRLGRTWVEYLCGYVPWSLYTSWVLGAAIISTFIATGLPVQDTVNGGLAALACAAFANLLVLAWVRDPWFAGVNVWALVAIAKGQSDLPQIQSAAFVLAGVVGAAAAVVLCLNVYDAVVASTTSSVSNADSASVDEAMLEGNGV